MELQAEAERRKRASILESEGQRQAVINVAEGSKQEVGQTLPCTGQLVAAAAAGGSNSRSCPRLQQKQACYIKRAVLLAQTVSPSCFAAQRWPIRFCSAVVLQVILSSEAEKQAAINRANGEAQAITARAQVGAPPGNLLLTVPRFRCRAVGVSLGLLPCSGEGGLCTSTCCECLHMKLLH